MSELTPVDKLAIEHGAHYVQGKGDYCFMKDELEALRQAILADALSKIKPMYHRWENKPFGEYVFSKYGTHPYPDNALPLYDLTEWKQS